MSNSALEFDADTASGKFHFLIEEQADSAFLFETRSKGGTPTVVRFERLSEVLCTCRSLGLQEQTISKVEANFQPSRVAN